MLANNWVVRENISDCDLLIHIAKLAEKAERYEDMVAAMRRVVELGNPLTTEGRNLFSVAYKNLVGIHRSSHRMIIAIRVKEGDTVNPALDEISGKVISDFESVCNDVLNLLKNNLIPNETSDDGEVFFKKMQGDYYRYLAEFLLGEKREEAVKNALESYHAATNKANVSLSKTHPTRLGLALNFSVFYYETMNDPEKACELAKCAFDEAVSEMSEADADSTEDSAVIMQLLRDNLTLWASERETDK